MSIARNMMFNAYTGGIAAITAVVAHKVVDTLWTTVTGEEPPEANNPNVPPAKAFSWVLANAVTLGVLGVAANRFAARRWEKFNGEELGAYRQVNLKL